MYLFERQRRRDRGGEGEILHPLCHSSLPHKSQLWTGLKPGTRNSVPVSHVGCRGPSSLDQLPFPFQVQQKGVVLEGKWQAGKLAQPVTPNCNIELINFLQRLQVRIYTIKYLDTDSKNILQNTIYNCQIKALFNLPQFLIFCQNISVGGGWSINLDLTSTGVTKYFC